MYTYSYRLPHSECRYHSPKLGISSFIIIIIEMLSDRHHCYQLVCVSVIISGVRKSNECDTVIQKIMCVTRCVQSNSVTYNLFNVKHHVFSTI